MIAKDLFDSGDPDWYKRESWTPTVVKAVLIVWQMMSSAVAKLPDGPIGSRTVSLPIFLFVVRVLFKKWQSDCVHGEHARVVASRRPSLDNGLFVLGSNFSKHVVFPGRASETRLLHIAAVLHFSTCLCDQSFNFTPLRYLFARGSRGQACKGESQGVRPRGGGGGGRGSHRLPPLGAAAVRGGRANPEFFLWKRGRSL
jgi:hypothetical protein